MSGIILGLFTVVLILVSAFLVLIILMQRASANSGMGSALGGGAAESALGGEAGNVLTKLTVKASVIFFIVAFGLYLGHIARFDANSTPNLALPTIEEGPAVEAEPVGTGLTAMPDFEEEVSAAQDNASAPDEAGVESGEAEGGGRVESSELDAEATAGEIEAAADELGSEASDSVGQGASSLQDASLQDAAEVIDGADALIEDSGETPAP